MDAYPNDEDVRSLYRQLLDRWNDRDAEGMAALCAEDGHMVGFDGSMLDGRAEIAATLRQIFSDHEPGTFVGKVRGVTFLLRNVAVLRAVAGMVPRGKSDLDPALNAVQSLVAAKDNGDWRIVLFHNTPAAFHGRPHLSEELTEELREVRRGESQRL